MTKDIILEKLFLKHYYQRIANNSALASKYEERVDLFLEDRKNPVLKDHQLKGKLRRYRSFSIAGDCRVIYYEKESNIIFVFVDVGSHNQVY